MLTTHTFSTVIWLTWSDYWKTHKPNGIYWLSHDQTRARRQNNNKDVRKKGLAIGQNECEREKKMKNTQQMSHVMQFNKSFLSLHISGSIGLIVYVSYLMFITHYTNSGSGNSSSTRTRHRHGHVKLTNPQPFLVHKTYLHSLGQPFIITHRRSTDFIFLLLLRRLHPPSS